MKKLWTALFISVVQLPIAGVVSGLVGIQNGLPFWVMGMAAHYSVRSATNLSFRRRLAMWLMAMTVGIITAGVGAIAISLLMQITAPYALAGQKGGEPSTRVTNVFWFVVAIRTAIEWAPVLVALVVSGILVRRSARRGQVASPPAATRQGTQHLERQVTAAGKDVQSESQIPTEVASAASLGVRATLPASDSSPLRSGREGGPDVDPRTAALLSRRRVGSWFPNRRQWWVIWSAYAMAGYINANEMDLSGYRSNNPERVVTAFVVVGAALLVWRLSKSKADRGW